MRLKIKFYFPNSTHQLLFDVLDNPGAMAWANHCKKLPPRRQLISAPLIFNPHKYDERNWQLQQKIQQGLANTPFAIPAPVQHYDEIAQMHLNVWHRWFTDHTRTMDRNVYPNEFHLLHELNQVVHNIENCLTEWPWIRQCRSCFETRGPSSISQLGTRRSHTGTDHTW